MQKKKIGRVALLSLIVVLATFKQSFFFGYYALFTDDFIATFCVNKDQPELSCDGKCFLSDLIDQQEADSPDIPSHIQWQLIYLTHSENLEYIQQPISSKQNFMYLDAYTYQYSASTFRPPSV